MPRAVPLWKHCVSGGASNIYEVGYCVTSRAPQVSQEGAYHSTSDKIGATFTLLSGGSAKQACVIMSPNEGGFMYLRRMIKGKSPLTSPFLSRSEVGLCYKNECISSPFSRQTTGYKPTVPRVFARLSG